MITALTAAWRMRGLIIPAILAACLGATALYARHESTRADAATQASQAAAHDAAQARTDLATAQQAMATEIARAQAASATQSRRRAAIQGAPADADRPLSDATLRALRVR